MKRHSALFLVLCLGLGWPAADLRADTVILKTGQELEGEILEKAAASVLIKVEYGTLRVAREKIRAILPDTPRQIARRKAAAEAKRQLEETMRRSGRVLYKGKWVTPEVKEKAEAKIAEQKAKQEKKAAEQAKKAAEEAKRKAKQRAKKGPSKPWADRYVEWRRNRRTNSNNRDNRTNRNNSTNRNRYGSEYTR